MNRPTSDYAAAGAGTDMTTVAVARALSDDPRLVGPGIRLLLWQLQSSINLGMLLRVAETYRVRVGILGTDDALSPTTRDFACGALERAGFDRFADQAAAEAWRGSGRLIATSIERGAVDLPDFRFEPGDVVVLGNEYDGLPGSVENAADCKIIIPMAAVWTPKPRSISPIDRTRTKPVSRDGEPNLNVAVAGAIVCYAAYVQAMTAWSARNALV